MHRECAGSVKFTVPTGSVPRVDRLPSGVLYTDPRDELERRLLQPDPPPGPMKGLSNLYACESGGFRPTHSPGIFSLDGAPQYEMTAINMATGQWRPAVDQAVDDYLLMERKARAWDDLRAVAVVERWGKVLALMDMKVHPAQPSAPAKG